LGEGVRGIRGREQVAGRGSISDNVHQRAREEDRERVREREQDRAKERGGRASVRDKDEWGKEGEWRRDSKFHSNALQHAATCCNTLQHTATQRGL